MTDSVHKRGTLGVYNPLIGDTVIDLLPNNTGGLITPQKLRDFSASVGFYARAESTDLTSVSQCGFLYTKEVSSNAELFYIDDHSHILQLTNVGKLHGLEYIDSTNSQLLDVSSVCSIDWKNRYLKESGTAIVAKWELQQLIDTDAHIMMDWSGGGYDVAAALSFDASKRVYTTELLIGGATHTGGYNLKATGGSYFQTAASGTYATVDIANSSVEINLYDGNPGHSSVNFNTDAYVVGSFTGYENMSGMYVNLLDGNNNIVSSFYQDASNYLNILDGSYTINSLGEIYFKGNAGTDYSTIESGYDNITFNMYNSDPAHGKVTFGADNFTVARFETSGANYVSILDGSKSSFYDSTSNYLDIIDGTYTIHAKGNTYIEGILTATSISSPTITDSSMTLGSVLFAGTGGLISQNNSKLFWDNTNYRLGIGNAVPSYDLDVTGTIKATTYLGSFYDNGTSDYVSVYPPAFAGTYIVASSNLNSNYVITKAFDTATPLTGSNFTNSWYASSVNGQQIIVDFGSGNNKTIKRIYYENAHDSGASTNAGVKNVTFWGSNSPSDFASPAWKNNASMASAGWSQITLSAAFMNRHWSDDSSDKEFLTVTSGSGSYRYYSLRIGDDSGTTNSAWGTIGQLGIRRLELQIQNTPGASNLTFDSNARKLYSLNKSNGTQVALDFSTPGQLQFGSTMLQTPLLYGSRSASGVLTLQGTDNATAGYCHINSVGGYTGIGVLGLSPYPLVIANGTLNNNGFTSDSGSVFIGYSGLTTNYGIAIGQSGASGATWIQSGRISRSERFALSLQPNGCTTYGYVGIGISPAAQNITAILHIGASTGLANQAPLKFNTGTLLTTPETGAIEFNTPSFYMTAGAAANNRQVIPGVTTGTSAPGTTPVRVGDLFIDTTGKKIYCATGTSGSSDWTILN